MWMQMLDMQFGGRINHGVVASNADGAGSTSEIGIQHLRMSVTGTGELDAQLVVNATATGGGHAHTQIGDISTSIAATEPGSSSYLHMGFAEPIDGGHTPGMLASANGAGSQATIDVGSFTQEGHGDDVYVFSSGIFAEGMNGGIANTNVGNVSFLAEGNAAHSYLLIDASTDWSAGAQGNVDIAGNVDLQAIGNGVTLTRAFVFAEGTGTVDIDGHLNIDSEGALGGSTTAIMQLHAQGGSTISVESLGMTVTGGGHGWMDLFSDHDNGLDVGSVNLTTDSNSDITLNSQYAINTLEWVNEDGTVHPHGTDTADSFSIASANLMGTGTVYMNLGQQTFGTINQGGTMLDLHYQLQPEAFHTAAELQAGHGVTVLNGFSAAATSVEFDGIAASDTNFADIGGVDGSADDLMTALDTALDGTTRYVFAVYNGAGDINGDGTADTGAGVLAYDNGGDGVTSVLMLPGVTSMNHTDLA